MDDLDLVYCAYLLSQGDDPARELVVRDDWIQATSPTARTHYRNGVHHAVLPAADANRRIAETCRHYASLGLPFRWVIGPRSRPADLEERLLRAGFVPFQELCGLLLDLDAADIPAPADITVSEVHEPDVWVDVTARGWGMDAGGRARFRAQVVRTLGAESPQERYYVASREGVPIGAAAVMTDEAVAYLSGAVVLPAYRGRGAYRALLARRAEDLRTAGFDRAANLAVSDTSAPICLRVDGFREICRFRVLTR